MRMKRWESPRREGRNDKGKKKSARQRQIKKQTQVWRQKLKGDGPGGETTKQDKSKQSKKERFDAAPFVLVASISIYSLTAKL